jgi:hypothetical protein
VSGLGAQERLVVAGWVFAAGSAIHLFDHLRRGQGSVSDELYWLGILALIVQTVVVTLIVTRHPRAPHAAVIAGYPLAIGFVAAHWVPEWSVISDPVWQVDSLAWFSSLASTAEVVGALLVGLAGLAVLREQRGATSTVGVAG